VWGRGDAHPHPQATNTHTRSGGHGDAYAQASYAHPGPTRGDSYSGAANVYAQAKQYPVDGRHTDPGPADGNSHAGPTHTNPRGQEGAGRPAP